MDSLTQKQVLFATCSDMNRSDGLLVVATGPEVERFGWTMFDAVEQKPALLIVDITAGEVTTAITQKMFLYHVSMKFGWSDSEAQEDVLKCIMMTPGERFAIMNSPTKQQESFATLSDTDTMDGLLKISTVPAVDKYGSTTFIAMVQNQTSHSVNTTTGVVTTVHTVTMFPSHASPTRLTQLLWLEEEVRGLDALKYSMPISGEPFVMMDSLTQRQELSATPSVSDMSEKEWTSICIARVVG